MRFDDVDYVKEYEKSGKFPKIHDDIFLLDSLVPKGNVMDLGCCTGLLSARLAEKHNFVVGVEANAKYLEHAVNKNNIAYVNMKIAPETLWELEKHIRNLNINIVYARRVLPEICDAGGVELVKDMLTMFSRNGVEYIVIEGRKCNSKSTHTLKNIDRERALFGGLYSCKQIHNQCALFAK